MQDITRRGILGILSSLIPATVFGIPTGKPRPALEDPKKQREKDIRFPRTMLVMANFHLGPKCSYGNVERFDWCVDTRFSSVVEFLQETMQYYRSRIPAGNPTYNNVNLEFTAPGHHCTYSIVIRDVMHDQLTCLTSYMPVLMHAMMTGEIGRALLMRPVPMPRYPGFGFEWRTERSYEHSSFPLDGFSSAIAALYLHKPIVTKRCARPAHVLSVGAFA